jgi:hypothetical protein
MRRLILAAVVGLSLLAIVAPAVSAKMPATSFVAKSSAAAPGTNLHLLAKVKHATRASTYSAVAVVHFASGDQMVTLTNRGRSFTANSRVVVPDTQPLGVVGIDFTITYNGVAQAPIHVDAKIQPSDQ